MSVANSTALVLKQGGQTELLDFTRFCRVMTSEPLKWSVCMCMRTSHSLSLYNPASSDNRDNPGRLTSLETVLLFVEGCHLSGQGGVDVTSLEQLCARHCLANRSPIPQRELLGDALEAFLMTHTLNAFPLPGRAIRVVREGLKVPWLTMSSGCEPGASIIFIYIYIAV